MEIKIVRILLRQTKIALPFLYLTLAVFSVACAFEDPAAEDTVQDGINQLMQEQRMLDARLSQAEDQLSRLQSQMDALSGGAPVRSNTEDQPMSVWWAEEEVQTGPKIGSDRMPVLAPPVPAPAPRSVSSRPAARKDASAEAYDAALADLQAGRYQQAEAAFKDFPGRYSQSALLPNAGYWLGETYYSRYRYDDAILAFQAVVKQYPRHAKAAASLLKTAYSYEHLKDVPNARFYLQQLLRDYPASEPAILARSALARLR